MYLSLDSDLVSSTSNDTSTPSSWAIAIQDLQIWDKELHLQDLVQAMSVSNSYYSFDPSKLLHWKFTRPSTSVVDLTSDGASPNLSGIESNFNSTSSSPAADTIVTEEFVIKDGSYTKETASINPNLPCKAAVFPNTWYFSAPPAILSTWSTAVHIPYGARLQFDLMSPSHNGDERVIANTVLLSGAGGVTLTCTSPFGRPVEDEWTHHSILLDETAGTNAKLAGTDRFCFTKLKHFLT